MSWEHGELRRLDGDHEVTVAELREVDLEAQTLRLGKINTDVYVALVHGPQRGRLYLPCEAQEPCEWRCVADIQIEPSDDDLLDATLTFTIPEGATT